MNDNIRTYRCSKCKQPLEVKDIVTRGIDGGFIPSDVFEDVYIEPCVNCDSILICDECGNMLEWDYGAQDGSNEIHVWKCLRCT